MGYCSTLYQSASLDTEVEPFVIDSDTKGYDGNKVRWYGFYGARVLEDGSIELADYNAKFYDADDFAKILAKKMKYGRIRLHFIGEDGEMGGLVIAPNAVVEYENENDYTRYFLEKGKELLIELLEEKKKSLAEKYRRAEEEIAKLKNLKNKEDDLNELSKIYMYSMALNPDFSDAVMEKLVDTAPDDREEDCPIFVPIHMVREIVENKGDEKDKKIVDFIEEKVDYVEIR